MINESSSFKVMCHELFVKIFKIVYTPYKHMLAGKIVRLLCCCRDDYVCAIKFCKVNYKTLTHLLQNKSNLASARPVDSN